MMIRADTEWAQLALQELPNIYDLLCYGSQKLKTVHEKITNLFWNDVVKAFARFSELQEPEMPHILHECMWFSDYTKFNLSIIKDWNTKGIRFIADLVNEKTGKLHSKETLERSYNIKMTALCYTSLIKSLPDTIKTTSALKIVGPIIPLRMNKILNEINFPRHAYNTYVISSKNDNHRTREKWLRDVGCFDENSFLEVSKATQCNRAKIFQYKWVNRILSTNTYLKLIKVNENEKCTFCKQEPETLAHMYWYCPHIEEYISAIKASFINEYNISLNINPMTWFLPTVPTWENRPCFVVTILI